MNDVHLNALLNVLTSQDFYDFYNGIFESYITGDLAIKTGLSPAEAEEEVLRALKVIVERRGHITS